MAALLLPMMLWHARTALDTGPSDLLPGMRSASLIDSSSRCTWRIGLLLIGSA